MLLIFVIRVVAFMGKWVVVFAVQTAVMERTIVESMLHVVVRVIVVAMLLFMSSMMAV